MKKDKQIELWAKIIKLRVGKCEYCGRKEHLNAHHFVSRSNSATRYDPFNGICLCSGCHTLNNHSAHKDPFFKDNLIEKGIRTEEFFKELRLRANQIAKRSQIKIYWDRKLSEELQRIEKTGNLSISDEFIKF